MLYKGIPTVERCMQVGRAETRGLYATAWCTRAPLPSPSYIYFPLHLHAGKERVLPAQFRTLDWPHNQDRGVGRSQDGRRTHCSCLGGQEPSWSHRVYCNNVLLSVCNQFFFRALLSSSFSCSVALAAEGTSGRPKPWNATHARGIHK